ncbi:hypothetical protein EIP91_006847 [Steccherinum ochraceum]|uniref:Uncharacterized protein n=1 Tax=Steccherinum ochraceum TaxID=92696 RepID=A0A4R0RR03_9APHY|nr:hypothetical protein EIP91_006847 [Steccherinum ochraceum]
MQIEANPSNYCGGEPVVVDGQEWIGDVGSNRNSKHGQQQGRLTSLCLCLFPTRQRYFAAMVVVPRPTVAPRPATLTSLDTAASLDIKDLLAGTKFDHFNVISSTLSFTSTNSLYSLRDIPSFSTISAARPVSIRFTSGPIMSTAEPMFGLQFKPPVIIPVPSRLKSMLMEPICVDKWAERTELSPPPGHQPWEDIVTEYDSFPHPPWVPEGSLFPPEALRAILRHRRSTIPDSSVNEDSALLAELLFPSNDISSNSVVDSGDVRVPSAVVEDQQTSEVASLIDDEEEPTPSEMPSIMVSTSTAIVPISLESSQCLVAPAPLAVRRGLNLPTPLNLTVPGTLPPTSTKQDSDLYPGIPTPFLGSPSGYTPSFDYPADSTTVFMDLGTMCGNLRSLCPPLRTPDVFPPLPPLPPTDSDTPTLPDDDSTPEIPTFESATDDWAVFEDFLTDVASRTHADDDDLADSPGPEIKPLTPVRRASLANTSASPGDSDLWNNSSTLDETQVDSQDSAAEAENPKTNTPGSTRAQRRRTVIIETTDSTDRRRTRLTLDLSDLASRDGDAEESHEAIPWEASPPSHFSFDPGAFAHSTPHSRPASSATLRPPARGILKTQKNVRFSIIPSMHEYEDGDDAADDVDPTSPTLEHHRSPTPPPGGRRVSKLLKAGVKEEEDPSAKKNRASFPKHPVVRSLAKAASPPTSPTTPTAVLVSPKSPKTPKTHSVGGIVRRNPLRSVSSNARQSLPASAISTATSSPSKDKKDKDKASRNSTVVVKEEIGKPKRLRVALSLPPPAQEKKVVPCPTLNSKRATVSSSDPARDGAKRKSSSMAKGASNSTSSRNSTTAPPPKSKMHVPFRSMWTKFRA